MLPYYSGLNSFYWVEWSIQALLFSQGIIAGARYKNFFKNGSWTAFTFTFISKWRHFAIGAQNIERLVPLRNHAVQAEFKGL